MPGAELIGDREQAVQTLGGMSTAELCQRLLRQIRFSGSGKPQDLVGKVGLAVSSQEPTKAAKELRQGNLSGKENARMGATGFLPQGGKPEEVFSIERQNGSLFTSGKGQLLVIR